MKLSCAYSVNQCLYDMQLVLLTFSRKLMRVIIMDYFTYLQSPEPEKKNREGSRDSFVICFFGLIIACTFFFYRTLNLYKIHSFFNLYQSIEVICQEHQCGIYLCFYWVQSHHYSTYGFGYIFMSLNAYPILFIYIHAYKFISFIYCFSDFCKAYPSTKNNTF